MVLLEGLNYDYSGQETSFLIEKIGIGETTLQVDNTEGFTDDDYLILDPGNEICEIVRINAVVSSNQSLTITATKFAHEANVKVYRTPYNKMHFYESSTATGTYSLIVGSETEMTFATKHTNFSGGTAGYYYKRIFYNDTSSATSLLSDTVYWQTDDEELYITPEELRIMLQFGENDYPNKEDLRFIIRVAMKKITLDLDTSNENILFIATMLLAKTYTLRGLASRSVSKGYVHINAEGRSITKAYQELVLAAENTFQEYKEFIVANNRTEAQSTQFMDDTTMINSWTRAEIIGMMQGQTNAVDFQYGYRNNFWFGRRSSP